MEIKKYPIEFTLNPEGDTAIYIQESDKFYMRTWNDPDLIAFASTVPETIIHHPDTGEMYMQIDTVIEARPEFTADLIGLKARLIDHLENGVIY